MNEKLQQLLAKKTQGTTAVSTPTKPMSALERLKKKVGNKSAVVPTVPLTTPTTAVKKKVLPLPTVSKAQEQAQQEVAVTEKETFTKNFTPTDEMYQIAKFDPDSFMSSLSSLQDQLLANAPGMPSYLRQIHQNLKQYPELTHLLDDSQIKIIVSGLLKKTNTDMAAVATKKRGSKKSAPLSESMCQELF